MYFDEPAAGQEPLSAGRSFRLVLSANGLAVLGLGLFPGLLLGLCAQVMR
jgi:NADH-quinone oxidoreductase subunit N